MNMEVFPLAITDALPSFSPKQVGLTVFTIWLEGPPASLTSTEETIEQPVVLSNNSKP